MTNDIKQEKVTIKARLALALVKHIADLITLSPNFAIIREEQGWHVKERRWTKSASKAEAAKMEWTPITGVHSDISLALYEAKKYLDERNNIGTTGDRCSDQGA